MANNGWHKITVSQFCELKQIKFEDFETETDYFCNIVSIVLDKPIDEVYNYPLSELKQRRAEISFIQTPPKAKVKSCIEVEGEKLYLFPNLNFLTVGEFIDLEHYVTNDYHQNLKLILAILYRRQVKEETNFYAAEYEPYSNYIFIRQQLFEDLPLNDVYGALKYYLTWRDKIYTSYSILFKSESEDDISNEELQQADPATRAELIKEQIHQAKVKKWAWNLFLYRICDLYGCDEEKAASMNLLNVLNRLSTKVELNA